MADAVDQAERAKFDDMAARWWDPDGPMRPLHAQSAARIGLIRDGAAIKFHRDPGAPDALTGLRIADVGCGGGLLCEPLARLGAAVV
ncbi:MAG: bifunctional 3-demethylubiquinol 3-O-methyltransferase/2-polyprenyl-6-hydroxyphenol methylase, partial [Pseudomonadota bacterium]